MNRGIVGARRRMAISLAAGMVIVACLALTARAGASQPVLWQRCGFGHAAGECDIPRGLATDPETGHVFVADQDNSRIDEFTVWGAFVKAWGWGVLDGSSELQVCTAATGCQKGLGDFGIGGSGSGELDRPQGLATDSNGNVYVVDLGNHRVQKFNRDGQFLLMLGGDVNKTKVEAAAPQAERNRCPIDPGDVCQKGTQGAGAGEFDEWPPSSYIAVGPDDTVYVGDKGRIQAFSAAGIFEMELAVPQDLPVGSLAADPKSGDLYFSYFNPEVIEYEAANHNVFRLDPVSGLVTDTLEVPIPRAVATAAEGSVYVFDQRALGTDDSDPAHNHITRLLRFDEKGNFVEVTAQNKSSNPNIHDEFETSTGLASGSACFESGHDVYLSNSTVASFVKAYGPVPDQHTAVGEDCAPPQLAPSIEREYAISVGTTDAVLGAAINPHFWPDTRFYVEFGTGKCSEGECTAVPVPPGQLLGGGSVDFAIASPGISLSGLEPNTTYRYRFVAVSSGGGPTVGLEQTFTTFRTPTSAPCPLNEGVRIGASARLPDCRAYEMVSPIDKDGGDIVGGGGETEVLGSPLLQSSLSGDAFTYSSYRAFADPKSAPLPSQYLAHRDPGRGWEDESIAPPQEGPTLLTATGTAQLDKPFKAFSEDLGFGWNETYTEPVLGLGGVAGLPNIYRRENSTAVYESCTSVEPADPAVKRAPELEGVNPAQDHALFKVRAQLTPEAGSAVDQLYECSFEGGVAAVRLVSLLPNGSASAGGDNAAGTVTDAHNEPNEPLHFSWLEHALSDDGTRVFWSVDVPKPGSQIYVRVNATQEQSPVSGGKCTKAFKACTYPVSVAEPARFWGARPDGSEALFAVAEGAQKGNLYRFDVAKAIAGENPRTLIAGETRGVLGASEDLSRVYFVSEEELGGGGTAGRPNLYLEDGGTVTFLATLSDLDINRFDLPSPVNTAPSLHTAQLTADGSTLVFNSNDPGLAQSVAGFDNRDLATGEPDAEVYRYEVGGQLSCLSCDPSGARPGSGRATGLTVSGGNTIRSYAAAVVPAWPSSLYSSHALSSDGRRFFFESYVPLLPTDTNERADVYEWEGPGTGNCDEAASGYVPASQGCLALISSGRASSDSLFMDASAVGDDVFFTTAESLVAQDPGSIDAYDARVGGGFPPPPQANPGCEGSSCQTPAPPPGASAPASEQFHGAGNVHQGAAAKHCRKGTRRVKRHGKTVCVKKRKAKRKHHARTSGRAGR